MHLLSSGRWGGKLTNIAIDEKGFPVLFAVQTETPPKKKRASEPGNENLPDLVTPDATSGPAEWGRYHDAVREAARSFDNPDVGDVHHFLNARARHPERVDAPSFHEAVRRQRMGDLVDILDHHMRRGGSLPRGHRMVRVQAPKGYVRRALRQSSPEDIAHIRHRLRSIGHSQENVDQHISDRIAPDMWDQAQSIEVHMSEEEFSGLIFDDGDFDFDAPQPWQEEIIEALEKIQPVINVFVNTGTEEKPDAG
jgi:hypothetical protein